MGRKIYKVPTTELFRVELEGTFASSVVQENPQSGVTTSGHKIGIDVDFSDTNYNNDNWNNGEGWS